MGGLHGDELHRQPLHHFVDRLRITQGSFFLALGVWRHVLRSLAVRPLLPSAESWGAIVTHKKGRHFCRPRLLEKWNTDEVSISARYPSQSGN